jgi:hypothetical protein
MPVPPEVGGGFAINHGAIGKTGLLVFGNAGNCGPGRDTALVDRRDRVRGCVRVERR